MAYLGKTPSQAVRSRYYFTASGGETSLSGTDDNSNTLTYTDGNYVDVSLNGVALVAGSDYNTTTANTIGGLTALTASDVVEVVVYDTFSVFGGNVKGDFDISNGTLSAEAVTVTSLTTTGNINFGDNDKAVFGAGSDLQIYHDGNNSLINDLGDGDLRLRSNGSGVIVEMANGNDLAQFLNGSGEAKLMHNGSEKLATTSSGIDVTGSVTADDDIRIDGAARVNIDMYEGDTTDVNTRLRQATSALTINTLNDAASVQTTRFKLDHATGDISFYDSTGVTQGLFWDASTQRLGLGTTGPATQLEIDGGASSATYRMTNDATAAAGGNGLNLSIDNSLNASLTNAKAGALTFGTSNAERIRIDSSGNVGIGESNPLSSLHIDATNGAENFIRLHDGDSDYGAALGLGSTGDFVISAIHGGTSTEALRVDRPNSNVLLGDATNVGTADHKLSIQKGTGGRCLGLGTTLTTSSVKVSFVNGNGTVGTIQTSGTSTSYNTSSDHRLKEAVVDMTGAIDRVKALAPKRFNFIADADTTVDGFLAHEAQAVVPEAVTGTHNEVDDDGNAVMQGIDQAKLVPLLTGALQEAIAKIEALETSNADLIARIETLENA